MRCHFNVSYYFYTTNYGFNGLSPSVALIFIILVTAYKPHRPVPITNRDLNFL